MPESRLSRRGLVAVGAAAPLSSLLSTPTAEAAVIRPIRLMAWEGLRGWQNGTREGLGITATGELALLNPTSTWAYTDPYGGGSGMYQQGIWTSAWTPVGFGLSEFIASWNATTGPDSFVEVAAQFMTATGVATGWFVLGRWTALDGGTSVVRTSVPKQSNTWGRVDTDTFVAAGTARYTQVRLRVKLLRRVGSSAVPRMRLLTGVASALPAGSVSVSAPGVGRGKVLNVPAWSQQVHLGHYPQWNGGGEAWCSATSSAMVAAYWGVGFTAAETSWVTIAGETRPAVDATARAVYDRAFGGTGNWPFNTAWAGTRGLRAYVTRLRSLAEAEQFIAAGVPLVCSVSFSSSQLTGAGYGTNGHLLVIVGFDSVGNVVCNDPASHLVASDAKVRVTYNRAQFENVWLPTSGGTVYVMAPRGRALPVPPAQANWA